MVATAATDRSGADCAPRPTSAPMSTADARPQRLIIVVSGPGGVGKGTIVDALVERDPNLWLSRSWTTRRQRPGERPDAYVFTTTEAFEHHIEAGGFLEWTEFLGNYYGTPRPDHLDDPTRPDIVLEIELDGAQQVKQQYPNAILIFVLPPSREEQERRLRGSRRSRSQGARPSPQGRAGRTGGARAGRPHRRQRSARSHGRRDARDHRPRASGRPFRTFVAARR